MQTAADEEARLKDPAGGGLTGQLLRAQAAKGIAPPNRAQILLGRILQGERVADEEVFDTLSAQDSLIVGSPDLSPQDEDLRGSRHRSPDVLPAGWKPAA